jgi:chemotaxis protein MotB
MMKHEEEFQRQEEGSSPQWIVTFADLMNLLLCFFVLLLSFSETDRAKYKQVAGSMKEAFGVVKESGKAGSPEGGSIVGRELDHPIQVERDQSGDRVVKKFDESVVEEKTRDLSRYVETESKGNKFIIRLQGEPTFESGSAIIRPEMIPVLRKVGEVLKYAKGDVIVAGHTDNVPIHSSIYPSNLELSVSRAVSVSQFMISNNYIQPGRLSTMGFGEYRPIASNDTSEGRARNRRVEIIVTDLFS